MGLNFDIFGIKTVLNLSIWLVWGKRPQKLSFIYSLVLWLVSKPPPPLVFPKSNKPAWGLIELFKVILEAIGSFDHVYVLDLPDNFEWIWSICVSNFECGMKVSTAEQSPLFWISRRELRKRQGFEARLIQAEFNSDSWEVTIIYS